DHHDLHAGQRIVLAHPISPSVTSASAAGEFSTRQGVCIEHKACRNPGLGETAEKLQQGKQFYANANVPDCRSASGPAAPRQVGKPEPASDQVNQRPRNMRYAGLPVSST